MLIWTYNFILKHSADYKFQTLKNGRILIKICDCQKENIF